MPMAMDLELTAADRDQRLVACSLPYVAFREAFRHRV